MKKIAIFIPILIFARTLSAQEKMDSCMIQVPNMFKKEGCGDQQIHMSFESSCTILDVEITIYNRWGNVLYTSNQLDHLWQSKEKDPGTYYYKITGRFSNGKEMNQNGYFNLF